MTAKQKNIAKASKTKTRSAGSEKSEERFLSAFENMLEGVQMLGHDWRYLYLNHAAEVHNRRPNQELLGNRYMDMWPGIEDTHVFSVIKHCLEERETAQLENRFVYPDGGVGWFNISIQPIPEGILILSFDITNRVRAEMQSTQMKRLYAALSQVNQTIVRVKNQHELFESICKVAVEFGEFPLAWIGLLDHESRDMSPVAVHARGPNQLPFQSINIKEPPYKEGLIGLSLQSGLTHFSNDIQADPRMAHWHETAIKNDYHSAAAIPFRKNGKVIGMLNLYAVDYDFFLEEAEQNLLKEMGMDISFALDTLESEKLMHQWADAFEHCAHGIAIGLPSGKLLTCNPAFARAHGAAMSEIASMPILSMYAPQDHEQIKQFIAEADRKGNVKFEANKVRKDGSIYPVEMDLVSVRDESGNLLYRVATQQDITERKKAEEKLRETQELFRLLFNLSPVAYSLARLSDHTIVEVNPACENLFEYTENEVVGKRTTDLDFWVDQNELRNATEAFRRDGSLHGFEFAYKTKSGVVGWAITYANIIEQAGERYVFSAFVNFTERKQAEEALQESDARLSGMIGSAMDAIITMDEEQRIMLFNPAAEQMFGCSAADVMGQPLDILLPERVRSSHREHVRVFGETRLTRRAMGALEPLSGLRANAEEFPVEASISQLESGGQKFYTVILRDVRERKRAEEALRESAQKYSAIFEKSPFAITLTKLPEVTIVGVNDAFLELFEFTRVEVIGKTSVELGIADEESRAQVAAELRTRGRVHDFEVTRLTRSGKRLDFALSLDRVTIVDEGYILTTIRDITEFKKAEEALRTKNEEVRIMSQQLWQAAKLATMGELAASIAHELNNPLATVSLRAEMLQARFSDDDPESRSLQIIDSEIKRMSSLVANLLQFSRRSASQISTIKVNEEVINALDLIQYHLRKYSILTVQELSPNTRLILADRQQLRQVLLNLFTNAADAMPQGGLLTIRTWSGEKPEAGITSPLKRQVTASLGLPVSEIPQVFIEVSDTGEGIPSERLEEVWEPFYTTKPEGKGTGLGLAICRRIIQEHGGSIEIISDGIPGKGTTVWIALPALKER